MEFAPPQELVAAVEARGLAVRDWKDVSETLQAAFDATRAAAEVTKGLLLEATNERDELRAELATVRAAFEELKAHPADTLGTRERETLLKMVLGMAAGGYAFDPAAARSEATAQIVSDLEERGIGVTDDTVRKVAGMGKPTKS